MQPSDTLRAYLAAIAAHDDDAAETLVHHLTAADEAALVELASAGNVDEQWWAVRALARIGGAAGVPVLCAALCHVDSGIRAASALALGYVHGRAAAAVAAVLGEVAARLTDQDGMVRQAAADGLALCGDDAVPPLAQLLRTSQHQGARSRAASALRKIATMKSAAVLYPLLNDENHLVRMYAYEGLDEMGLLENILLMP
jgi:HEAT repeat protein